MAQTSLFSRATPLRRGQKRIQAARALLSTAAIRNACQILLHADQSRYSRPIINRKSALPSKAEISQHRRDGPLWATTRY